MSLHDTDKSNDTRNVPMPNMGDSKAERHADGTTAITNKKDGSSGAYVSTKDATIKVNDGTVNRIVLGLLSSGSYGVKVSKPTFDVNTATDSQLIFSSDYNSFKIAYFGSITLQRIGSTNTANATFNHNLGFIPSVFAYIDLYGTGYAPLPTLSISLVNGSVQYTIKVKEITTTQIIFEALVPTSSSVYASGGETYTIKFYLLIETAN